MKKRGKYTWAKSDEERKNRRKQSLLKYETGIPEKMMLCRARHRAKRLGFPFSITIEDFKIPDVCPVLGIKLQLNKGGRSGYFASSPSLDRIRPEEGYIPGNVRVISSRANLLKSDGSLEEHELVVADLRRCLATRGV